MLDSIYTVKQDRWNCAHCGASGWWVPSRWIGKPPTQEHDRPDGRKCLLAGLSDEELYLRAMRNGMPSSGRHG
jgi:hypothetical protein